MKRFFIIFITAVSAAMLGAGAQAQDSNVQLEPGVARMSLIQGDVSMQRGDSQDWEATTLNTPLEAGDRVSTGERSRGEVQLDYANVLRMDQNATAKIAQLDRNKLQLQVGAGLVNYSVLKGNEAQAEIDTPNMSVHPLDPGDYRIQVNSNSETMLIVRNGQADVSTPQGSTRIDAGNMITVQGTDNPQYQTAGAPHRDDFDSFNSDRDRLIANATSYQDTNHYYTGAQDLDAYGSWRNVPDYGPVWVPAAAPGWAPYHDGRWVWEPYYGWTWVSYEPWGWAPYHYGRWFLDDDQWVWWPGPVEVVPVRPIWAPAFVSFFGFGRGFGVGFGFGSIGWLPIGPCDGFFPWWGRGFGRGGREVNVVNVTNITNITNITNVHNGWAPLYRGNGRRFSNLEGIDHNPRLLRSVSLQPAERFGKAAVQRTGGISAATFRSGSMMTGAVPSVPGKASLRSTNATPRIPAKAASFNNQKFFSRTPAPQVQRSSFNQQAAEVRSAIKNSAEQPKLTADARTPDVRGNANSNATRSFSKEGSATEAKPGTAVDRSFGEQPKSQETRQASDGAASNGWHRFGETEIAQNNSKNSAQESSNGSARENGRTSTSTRGTSDQPSRGAGWHTFSRNDDGSSGVGTRSQGSAERSNSGVTNGPRSSVPRDQNWRGFNNDSAYSNNSRDTGTRETTPRESAPADSGWHRFSEGGTSNRSNGTGNDRSGQSESPHTYNRPPLDMNQPVVRPRSSYGNSDRYSQGGSYGNGQGSYRQGGYSQGGYRSSGGNSGARSNGSSRSSSGASRTSSNGSPHGGRGR